MSFTLTSTAFTDGGEIPRKYTADGQDVSPPLDWADVPPGSQSLALIVEDPDAPDPAAPQRIWVHWVLYDLPIGDSGLREDAAGPHLPTGSKLGLNDWQHAAWGGPNPPRGRHRYFFRLYALDTVLPDLHNPDKRKLEQAMQGHVIERAELMGTYQH